MTSFRPDQTSLTAQTFMSTKPRGSASSHVIPNVPAVVVPQ